MTEFGSILLGGALTQSLIAVGAFVFQEKNVGAAAAFTAGIMCAVGLVSL